MNEQELQRGFLFILHRGLVEARLLAQAKQNEQIADLADALESLPSYMDRWDDTCFEAWSMRGAGWRIDVQGGGTQFFVPSTGGLKP